MRSDAPDVAQRGAWTRNETVPNAQRGLAHDVERMGTEQIVVLMHRPGERILDRHETAVRVVLLDRAKEVLERDARNDAGVGAEHGNRSGVAERSRFSLDGDAGHASVTAPRLLLETRRVYLARTPDL